MTESDSAIDAVYECKISDIRNTKKIRGDGFSIIIAYSEFQYELEFETPSKSTVHIKLTRITPTRIEFQESLGNKISSS